MKVMVTELPEVKDMCPFVDVAVNYNEVIEDYVCVYICKCTKDRCDLKDNQCSGLYKF